MATTVVNIKHKSEYDVYIGRGKNCKWGNPYSHLFGTLAKYKVATKEEAIAKYQEWLPNQTELMADLHELKDQRLGCFCRPKRGFKGKIRCHGQILAALCDNIKPEEVL